MRGISPARFPASRIATASSSGEEPGVAEDVAPLSQALAGHARDHLVDHAGHILAASRLVFARDFVRAEERRDDVHGVASVEVSNRAQLRQLRFSGQAVAALRLTGRGPGCEHLVEARPGCVGELGLRRRARQGDGLHDPAALGGDRLVGVAQQAAAQLVLSIAGEDHVRVRIDESGNDGAPAGIEAHRVGVQIQMTFGIRGRTDMDDDALVRGDDGVAKRRDVALRRAAPRRRAGARGDEAGVLDEKVRGDAHGLSVTQNSQCETQTMPAPVTTVTALTARDCDHFTHCT